MPDRSMSPILWELLRVYPQATAGQLISYSFDQAGRKFAMEYVSDTGIAKPTEIVIPSLLYPHGYDLTITGGKYRTETDERTHTLMIYAGQNGANIKVLISPK